MSEQWLSVEQVAKELNLSEDTIRNYIKSKKNPLPAARFGNTYRIKRADLDRFIQDRMTQGKEEDS